MESRLRENVKSPADHLKTAALIGLLAVCAYANTLGHGFVWDDHLYVESNEFIKKPANIFRLLNPSYFLRVEAVEAGARPVFVASLIVDHALWGGHPAGYHATNVFLHAINAALFYFFLIVLGAAGPPAWLAAALFAVHPIATEAVNLITFRADLLAAFFVLSALHCYLKYRSTRAGSWLAWATAFFSAGLLSKEMAVSAPLIVFLIEYYFPEGLRRKPLVDSRPVWIAALTFALVAAAYFGFRSSRSGYAAISSHAPAPAAQAAPAPGSDTATENFIPSRPSWHDIYDDPALRFRTMAGVLSDYARWMVLPHPLQADRSPSLIRSWFSFRLIGSLFFLGLLLIFCWTTLGERSLGGLGVAWFFAALLPVSGVVSLYNPVAERYLYVVALGGCMSLAALIDWIGGLFSERTQPRVVLSLGASLILLFGVRTAVRNSDWKTDESLFGAVRDSDNERVHYNRALLAQKEGRLKEALAGYERVLDINPGYVEAMINAGAIFELEGRLNEAEKRYQKAVALNPPSPIPYDAYGVFLEKKEGPGSGISQFEKAIEKERRYVAPHFHLGTALGRVGRKEDAMKSFRTVLELEPEHEDARYNLAMLQDEVGDYASAEKNLREVLARNPGRIDAKMNLGVVLHHAGKIEEAEIPLAQAERLGPESTAVLYNQGIVLSDAGKLKEARVLLQKAVDMSPDYADALYALAVVQQRLENPNTAAALYRRVLKLEPDKVAALNNLGELMQRAGRLGEAQELLERALSVSGGNPSVLNNLGNVYFKRGMWEDAARSYLRSVQRGHAMGDAPEAISQAEVNLGRAYLKMGQTTNAISAWEDSFRNGNRDPALIRLLETEYARNDEFQRARNFWGSFGDADKWSTDALFRLKNPYPGREDLNAAYVAIQDRDFARAAQSLHSAWIRPDADAAARSAVFDLLKKIHEDQGNNVGIPAGWKNPSWLSEVEVNTQRTRWRSLDYQFSVRGNTIATETIKNVRIVLWPNKVVLDKDAGIGSWSGVPFGGKDVSVEFARPVEFNHRATFALSGPKGDRPAEPGLYTMTIKPRRGEAAEGWFFLHPDMNSTATPIIEFPAEGDIVKTSRPPLRWRKFRSPQHHKKDRLNSFVFIMRPGDPKVVWEGDRVDQKTEITVDVDLSPDTYDVVLFFSEAWPFGDLKIGRMSQSYNRFQIRYP